MKLSVIVEERSGIDRSREPVTLGIPFPKGALSDAARIRLSNEHLQPAPVQTQVIDRWSDQSCRWVIVDFQATVAAGQKVYYWLEWASNTSSVARHEGVYVEEFSDMIRVSSGSISFCLNKRRFMPFQRVTVQGKEIIEHASSRVTLVDDSGETCEPVIEKWSLEARGPLRATVSLEGSFFRPNEKKGFARFFSRLHFFAGKPMAKMDFTLRNPRAAKHRGGLWDLGDPGSIYFEDLSFHLEMVGRNKADVYWTDTTTEAPQKSSGSWTEIYQDSSGGKNWQSRNHVNRFGKVMNSFRGYQVRAGELIREGDRARPTILLSSQDRCLAAAVESFWENFPKALEAGDNRMVVRLFPARYADTFELQGGEQKTHSIYFCFAPYHESPNPLAWTHEPLMPRLDPEWYAESEAFPYLVSEAQDPNRDYLDLVHRAIDGDANFFKRREIIDEYGWRHFGELYADHEAVFHSGPTPLVSHYNNQYDAIYAFAAHYARSGDARWFCLMRDLARHVIDIDIYHTREDKPAYNGGLFWHTDHYTDAATCTHRTFSKKTMEEKGLKDYGGGPCNEHLYTTGLMTYYFLTGDVQAREAAIGLADWVIRMDDGNLTPLRFASRAATGLASQTVSRDFHGPGRGAGNSINALLDAYRLTREHDYLAKAEELICRCVHPADQIDSLDLGDAERRWSYLAFLQALGKYLDCKLEWGIRDDMFDYARASLLHYSRWLIEHEVPYSRVMDQLEYPTETWVVQDLRKSNILEWAGRYGSGDERRRFFEKAKFFYENCFHDLTGYVTKTCTRPLVLLLHYGCMHGYFQLRDAPNPIDWRDVPREFCSPQIFKSQRQLVEERLRVLVGIGGAFMISLLLLLILLSYN